MSSFHFTTDDEAQSPQEGVSWYEGGLLPPWLHFALAWRPRKDAPLQLQEALEPEHLCRLILEADGPLMAEAMPLFDRYRHRIPENCGGIAKQELLRLCHYRELSAQGRFESLWRYLDRELCKCEQSTLFHCEILNLLWQSRLGDGKLCQKAVDREFMLRSQGPPSWRLQRARWRSLGQPAKMQGTVLRASRAQGIQFHPSQLQPQYGCGLLEIDRLVRGLSVESLVHLLERLLADTLIPLRLDLQGWLALRPLLVSLFAGENQPFTELPLSCLPCPLPDHPEGLPPATLVIHCPGDRKPHPEVLPAGNWRVLCLHDESSSPGSDPERLELTWNQVIGYPAPAARTEVMPLRHYVNELEQRYIREVIQHHRGIKAKACASLGITRQTLYAKLGRGLPPEADAP